MIDVLPDGLWEIVQPLLPPPPKTGRPRADQRALLTTVLFFQASGCSWEKADGLFGVTRAAHRWLKDLDRDGPVAQDPPHNPGRAGQTRPAGLVPPAEFEESFYGQRVGSTEGEALVPSLQ
ncbi:MULTISPECIES: transposase [Nocardiopsis]|uniref:transposase n=1 Tax=Nocardiopsis TaxID=2013 RepID=UPI00117DB61A